MPIGDWRVRFCTVEGVRGLTIFDTHKMERDEIVAWAESLKKHATYKEVVGPVTQDLRFDEPETPILFCRKSICGGTEQNPLYSYSHMVSCDGETMGPISYFPRELVVVGEKRDRDFLVWIEQVPPEAKHREHVATGDCCKTCYRWSLEEGQAFLSQCTHPFSGGPEFHRRMFEDIIRAEMEHNDVETAPITEFGACLKHHKLIVGHATACPDYRRHSKAGVA